VDLKKGRWKKRGWKRGEILYWNNDLECRINVRKRNLTPRSIGLVFVEQKRQRDLITIRMFLFTYSVLEKEGTAVVAVETCELVLREVSEPSGSCWLFMRMRCLRLAIN
jgi:hypothetical protein